MSDDDLLPDAPSDAEWQPIRAALRAVAVPADARESAIAAALATADDVHAEPAAPETAAVVHLAARRTRAQRWLTAAAAVVAVLAVGGVVANRFGTTSDDTGDESVAVPALASAEQASTVEPSAVAKSAESAPMPESGGAVATADTAAPAVVLDDDALTSTMPVSTIGSIDGAANTGSATTVDSPDDLAAYARSVPGGGATAVVAPACLPTDSEVLGTVVYLGQETVVVRFPSTGEVAALDRLSCAVLATVRP